MKATYVRQYRKKDTGNLVFVYAISGTPAEIEAYEKAQGDFLIHDEQTKQPLMFTPRPAPKRVNNVLISRSGRAFIDTSDLDRKAALISQYGGNLGQAMAAEAAKEINLDFGSSAADVEVPEAEGSLTKP